MSQFAPEDSQGNIDFVSDGDVTFESDRNQDGVGDLVFKTGGVERARIAHDGTGTGWSNVLGGSITYLDAAGGGDDSVAINAALAANDVVVLRKADFSIANPIKIPSNTTLVLWNVTVTLAAGSNCNILSNSDLVSGDSYVAVHCIGHVKLDGNSANQTPQTSWKDFGVFFSNVTNLTIVGRIRCGSTCNAAFRFSGCTKVIADILEPRQDNAQSNQDGVGITNGSSDVTIGKIVGDTYDDALLISSFNTKNALLYTPATPGGTTQNIQVGQIHVKVGTGGGNVVRFLAGDGQTVQNIQIGQILLRNGSTPGAIVQFGGTSYVTTAPTTAQCQQITIGEIGGANGANGIFAFDASMEDFTVGLVSVTGTAPFLVGNVDAVTQSVNWVRIENVHIAGTVTDFMKFTSTVTVNQMGISGVDINGTLTSLLHNAASVNRLRLRDVFVNTLSTALTRSTAKETGSISNVVVNTLSGTSYLSTGFALKISGDFPKITSADTAPDATNGSMVQSTKILDGGSAGDGLYYADGTNWNRLATLAA